MIYLIILGLKNLIIYFRKCADVWECISKLQKQSDLLHYICSVQEDHSYELLCGRFGVLQQKPKAPLREQVRVFGLNSNCVRTGTAVGNRRHLTEMEKSFIPIPVILREEKPLTSANVAL